MDIIRQLNWRYATKKFDSSKKLTAGNIELLKQAFNLSATSFGLQPIKLIIVEEASLRASLVAHSYGQKQVSEASHLLIICIQDDISENDIANHFRRIKMLRNTPESTLKPHRDALYKKMQNMSTAERQQWSTNQAYIALGNLITVCAVIGIDACPMEGFVTKSYDTILGLDNMQLKSKLLLPVGYRSDDDLFSSLKKVRRPLKDSIVEL